MCSLGWHPLPQTSRPEQDTADRFAPIRHVVRPATLEFVTRWVLHVDLDQFIAAVEVLRHPELRGLPVVVGGDGDPTKRGVVSTASYEAREHGVHSGLPLRTAARRCPDAVFLAVVEVMGWDEAFLAVETADPGSYAREIQARVRAATSLDCTVGIGCNKLQAKIATGFGKPAGTFLLTDENWMHVLGAKPSDALWGIGGKTAKKLAELGIVTVADLASADHRALARRFGPTIGPWLVQTARGIDLSQVTAEPYVPRGHGREETFQRNIADWDQVRTEVARIARLVADDVAAEGRPAVRIVVKVRYAPFFTHTHGRTLAEPTGEADAIEAAALAALDEFARRDPVRLLGVRAEFAPA